MLSRDYNGDVVRWRSAKEESAGLHASWPYLQARNQICGFQKRQLAYLVHDSHNLGVHCRLGRVVSSRDPLLEERTGDTSAGRCSELAGAALSCVSTRYRHSNWFRRGEQEGVVDNSFSIHYPNRAFLDVWRFSSRPEKSQSSSSSDWYGPSIIRAALIEKWPELLMPAGS